MRRSWDQQGRQQASCQAAGSLKLKSERYTRFHLGDLFGFIGNGSAVFPEVNGSCLILPAFGEEGVTRKKNYPFYYIHF